MGDNEKKRIEQCMHEEFKTLQKKLLNGDISIHEYCKMADDFMLAYTQIWFPRHNPENYIRMENLGDTSNDDNNNKKRRKGVEGGK